MGGSILRPRVYLQFQHRDTTMRRVLDLAFLDGDRPIAVISWVRVDGAIEPGAYVELDPAKLRKSSPAGTYWYDGPVVDPRVPRKPPGGA